MSEENGKGRAREFWRVAASEDREAMLASLREALDGTSERWGMCPNCRRKVQPEFPDVKGRLDAIAMYHKLAGEIPKPEDEGGGSFVMRRSVVFQVAEGEGAE